MRIDCFDEYVNAQVIEFSIAWSRDALDGVGHFSFLKHLEHFRWEVGNILIYVNFVAMFLFVFKNKILIENIYLFTFLPLF